MQGVAYAPDWEIDDPNEPFIRWSTETKSKMADVAAMLDERSSKGTFLQLPPMSHQKIRPVDPCVGQKINGDQIQDGGRSGHLRWVAKVIIERNLPPVTLNEPPKNWTSRPRRWSENRRKPNPRWRPSGMSGGADHRKEPSTSHPNKPQKNRMNRLGRLSCNRRKPNVYGHRRIGHDIMPPTFFDQGHNNKTLQQSKG
jgi:hypothetical protein